MTTFATSAQCMRMLAERNGWTHKLEGYFGWWTETYAKGNQLIKVRWRNDRITDLQHITDLQRINEPGVILTPKRDKKAALVEFLEAE